MLQLPFSACCEASRSAINLLFPWDFIPLKSRGVFALPPASQTLEQALKLVFSQLNPIQVLKHSSFYRFLVSQGCEQTYVKDRAQGLESDLPTEVRWAKNRGGLWKWQWWLQTYMPACSPVLDPCREMVNKVLWCLSPRTALSGFSSSGRSLSSSFPQLSATRQGEGDDAVVLVWAKYVRPGYMSSALLHPHKTLCTALGPDEHFLLSPLRKWC